MKRKLFFIAAAFIATGLISCSDCNQPMRDAFNFYIVNGSNQDIFEADPALNKDSVYLAVVKNGVEQPATRSIFTREQVGVDTLNTFYNSNIPDLNVNSDTQTVILYTPHNRMDALMIITYDEVVKNCGTTLHIGQVKKGSTEQVKVGGYYKIVL